MLDADLFVDDDLPQWYADAACADRDPADWFPVKGSNYADALAVCEGCPVRGDCLEHALALEGDAGPTHRFGLWGGLTPKERAKLARQAA